MTLRPNLYDYLKVLALMTMIVDHIGFFFFPEIEILRVIGRVAFPLFLFLVGWNHSYRRNRSLWIWGSLFQIFIWVGYRQGVSDIYTLNILLVIGLVRIILGFLQQIKNLLVEVMFFVFSGLFFFSTVPYLDYGTMGLLFGILGYRSRLYDKKRYIGGLILGTVLLHLQYMTLEWGFSWNVVMISVGVLLVFGLGGLTRGNSSCVSQSDVWNRCILSLSCRSLHIYVVQAVFFSGIYILLNS